MSYQLTEKDEEGKKQYSDTRLPLLLLCPQKVIEETTTVTTLLQQQGLSFGSFEGSILFYSRWSFETNDTDTDTDVVFASNVERRMSTDVGFDADGSSELNVENVDRGKRRS